MNLKILLVFLPLLLLPSVAPHNILVILLDDGDNLPVTQTEGYPNITNFFKTNGVIYTNAFVTAPLCCPSRASILTGTYLHNHRTLNNNDGCRTDDWDERIAPNSFGKRLQDMGYRTGMFGKYSNHYNGNKVPVGWDDWLGLVGNSRYYNYNINQNGVNVRHGDDYKTDYLPKLIIERGISFMTDNSSSAPWCALLSFPSPHGPFDAAPQYQSWFQGSKPPSINYPSYNHTGDEGKHWYTRSRPPLDHNAVKYIQLGWRKRLQTLQSVDAGFVKIMKAIDPENTTIIFTSDNGYYFGEWGMFMDKRQPYEGTIRVPMFASGPFFPKNATLDTVVLNIDIAPTVVDIAMKLGAGCTVQNNEHYSLPFDGISMISLLSAPKFRTSFLVQNYGVGLSSERNECSRMGMKCWYRDNTVWSTQPKLDIPDGDKFCFCVDSVNNTYTCERQVSANNVTDLRPDGYFTDFLYCNFQSGFNEFYDLSQDPFQMNNSWSSLSLSNNIRLKSRLSKLQNCKGFAECSGVTVDSPSGLPNCTVDSGLTGLKSTISKR